MSTGLVIVRNFKHLKNEQIAVKEEDTKLLNWDEELYNEVLCEIVEITGMDEDLCKDFFPIIEDIEFNKLDVKFESHEWYAELWMLKKHIEFYDREINMIDNDKCSGHLKWIVEHWNNGYLGFFRK